MPEPDAQKTAIDTGYPRRLMLNLPHWLFRYLSHRPVSSPLFFFDLIFSFSSSVSTSILSPLPPFFFSSDLFFFCSGQIPPRSQGPASSLVDKVLHIARRLSKRPVRLLFGLPRVPIWLFIVLTVELLYCILSCLIPHQNKFSHAWRHVGLSRKIFVFAGRR